MTFLVKRIAVLMAASLLTACTVHDSGARRDVVTLDTAALMADQTLATADKAEKLALAGEQLTTPTGFMYADLVFDQALSVDPSNARARFYKAFLQMPMALRGILARVKTLAESHSKSKASYDEAVANLPDGGVKTFLFDGFDDLRTERDLQAFVDGLYDGQNQFRLFLKNNKDLELTLNLNDWAGYGTIQNAVKACAVDQVGAGVFDITRCNLATSTQLKLNRADVEALQQISAGLQIYMATYIAYDAIGTLEVARRHEGTKASNKVLWKELSANADFGKLRNPGALKNVMEMGIDAVAGVRWAAQIQDQLCPKGEGIADNRKGFLFGRGICIRSENDDGSKLEDTLKLVDSVFSAQMVEMKFGRDDEITTQIRPSVALTNPIADLKLLRPVYDRCDRVTAVSDGSLGGAFPNYDFNEILASSASCDVRP